jgi:uncharacterized protein YdeI (YjbR/CyaY-like superfamily)
LLRPLPGGVAERLIVDGRVRRAGLAEVERAKADGRWDAPTKVRGAAPCLATSSANSTRARRQRHSFAELNRQNGYAILYRLQDARKPETRARRLARFVAMLEAGETIHP